MKIKIESILDGRELIEYFVSKLKENNIDCPWKEGADLPVGVKILITNKNNEDIPVAPDKVKLIFNKE